MKLYRVRPKSPRGWSYLNTMGECYKIDLFQLYDPFITPSMGTVVIMLLPRDDERSDCRVPEAIALVHQPRHVIGEQEAMSEPRFKYSTAYHIALPHALRW